MSAARQRRRRRSRVEVRNIHENQNGRKSAQKEPLKPASTLRYKKGGERPVIFKASMHELYLIRSWLEDIGTAIEPAEKRLLEKVKQAMKSGR